MFLLERASVIGPKSPPAMAEMENDMSDWLENLPITGMALVVFAATYLVAGGIYWVVIGLARGDLGRAFKAVSPGMLPPLGIIFGLLAGFLAAQVWSDYDRAQADCAPWFSWLRASRASPKRACALCCVAISKASPRGNGRPWPGTMLR